MRDACAATSPGVFVTCGHRRCRFMFIPAVLIAGGGEVEHSASRVDVVEGGGGRSGPSGQFRRLLAFGRQNRRGISGYMLHDLIFVRCMA